MAEEWCAILWYDLMRSERTVENKEGEDMGPTALTAGVVDVILGTWWAHLPIIASPQSSHPMNEGLSMAVGPKNLSKYRCLPA